MDWWPSFEEIRRTFIEAVATITSDDEPVLVRMSMAEARVLAIRLGWCPTPTVAECRSAEGLFCCPACGATGSWLVHETGGADVPSVSGFSPTGGLVIGTSAARVPGNRWWIRCRHCRARFHPPPDIPIDWH